MCWVGDEIFLKENYLSRKSMEMSENTDAVISVK